MSSSDSLYIKIQKKSYLYVLKIEKILNFVNGIQACKIGIQKITKFDIFADLKM
jgi:hypothetical protein